MPAKKFGQWGMKASSESYARRVRHVKDLKGGRTTKVIFREVDRSPSGDKAEEGSCFKRSQRHGLYAGRGGRKTGGKKGRQRHKARLPKR